MLSLLLWLYLVAKRESLDDQGNQETNENRFNPRLNSNQALIIKILIQHCKFDLNNLIILQFSQKSRKNLQLKSWL